MAGPQGDQALRPVIRVRPLDGGGCKITCSEDRITVTSDDGEECSRKFAQ
ncbi:hypothetical protein KIPB_008597, partial [Kipferlia bialata]|eukprot:g8597.t1